VAVKGLVAGEIIDGSWSALAHRVRESGVLIKAAMYGYDKLVATWFCLSAYMAGGHDKSSPIQKSETTRVTRPVNFGLRPTGQERVRTTDTMIGPTHHAPTRV